MVVLERKMDILCEQRPDDGGTGKEGGCILRTETRQWWYWKGRWIYSVNRDLMMVVLERKVDIFCEQRPDDGGTGKEDGYIL